MCGERLRRGEFVFVVYLFGFRSGYDVVGVGDACFRGVGML